MLTVIHGVMKSGKTLQLLNEYDKIPHNKIAIKHKIDTRDKNLVYSRVGKEIQADFIYNDSIDLTSLELKIKENKITNIFISEFQFFDFDMYLFIINNMSKTLKFYVEGLLKDYQDRFFGYTYKLLNYATKIIKCDTFCVQCKEKKADISFRLDKSNSQILLGDSEYEPRCYNCAQLNNVTNY